MDKYLALIESIKNEYYDGMYRFYNDSEKNSNVLHVPGFVITQNKMEIDKSKKLIEYNVSEENSKKKWHFIIGPAMLLFANQMKKYREKILAEHSIQGVFTLKQGFFENSIIPAAVLMLDKKADAIWLTSVANNADVVSLLSNPSNYHRKIYFTEKVDPENLMPEHYNGELQRINAELDKFETKKLGEIAEVISGKSISSRDWCEAGIPYLRARDLKDGKITKSSVFISENDIQKCARQLVQEGDLLLSKSFGQYKIARVTEEDLPAVASNGLFIIRAYDIPEDYLFQYLTSETGKAIFDKQLSSIEKGSVVPSINLKELVDIRVPIFDEKTMYCLSSVDNLKGGDIIDTVAQMSRLMAYYKLINPDVNMEESLEKYVYQSFIDSGWEDKEISRGGKSYSVKLGNSKKWCPDIVLLNGTQNLAVVEIKMNLMQFTQDRLKTLREVVHCGDYPFLIITTGNYYEIHSANDAIIKKTAKAPTKEYLLSLSNGKEVQ